MSTTATLDLCLYNDKKSQVRSFPNADAITDRYECGISRGNWSSNSASVILLVTLHNNPMFVPVFDVFARKALPWMHRGFRFNR